MAEDPNDDRIEQFDLSPSGTPGVFTLYLKTKSEEFDLVIDKGLLQELVEEIQDKLAGEGKS